ncbi:putative hydro-lyase [Chelativorans xinjiangense]|uniref:putative hydro-lyase n=1 Tax=Chelativorans xinjiangense TaxID=2681485 RepID=UPI00135C3DE1|nr:putative hydro-lyase [Chelativorans xinjiangense]
MIATLAQHRLEKWGQGNNGHDIRLGCRSGEILVGTAGMAPGYVQGNLAILPKEYAHEFLRFCNANPRSCPVIGVSEAGSALVPALGEDLDIRTDLPAYHVWKDGEMVAEVHELTDWWRNDLVSFVIGCSLSFEEALMQEGLPLRHIEKGERVPMYRTNIPCAPAGRFNGPTVVSMRPLVPAQAIRAIQITTRFPSVHGAPIHIGLPEAIGIADITTPDYGDPNPPRAGEIPVFWACGVTPQAVIAQAKPSFAITHAPGCMLVTDRKNTELSIL